VSLFAEASDAEALAAKRLPTCDVQASGAWQRGHRADVRSVQAPRGEQRPVLQLHQLVPRKQVQDDVLSARMKNPICRAGNVSLGGHFDESDSGQVDDEFCHTHSAYFRGVCQRQERQRDASHTLTEFVEFLRREDAGVLPVMGAIAVTTTPAAATELLGATKADFCRVRSRLRQLGRCFQTGDPVPRKRRPYRSRARSPHR
jgi:hypothetical protein